MEGLLLKGRTWVLDPAGQPCPGRVGQAPILAGLCVECNVFHLEAERRLHEPNGTDPTRPDPNQMPARRQRAAVAV